MARRFNLPKPGPADGIWARNFTAQLSIILTELGNTDMADAGKQLGQVGFATATNAVLYRPPVNVRAHITRTVVCNGNGGNKTFSLFLNATGTQATTAEALYSGNSILANETEDIKSDYWLTSTAGAFIGGVNATSMTITVFGVETELN